VGLTISVLFANIRLSESPPLGHTPASYLHREISIYRIVKATNQPDN
jgi:hypothetical protein